MKATQDTLLGNKLAQKFITLYLSNLTGEQLEQRWEQLAILRDAGNKMKKELRK